MENLLKGKQLELIYEDDFSTNKDNFKLEGIGKYEVKNGALYFSDPIIPKTPSGSTLFINQDFKGDLYVSYNCKAINIDDAKNLNLFFLATTLDGKDVLLEEHSGGYGEYHETVKSYILTFTYLHTRVRKDPGFNMLSEDLNTVTNLNTNYFIEIFKVGTRILVKINDKLIHDFTDEVDYNRGKIGFRTWQSDTVFDNFKVYQIK